MTFTRVKSTSISGIAVKLLTLEPVGDAGSLLFNSEDGLLYYSDGVSWFQLLTGGAAGGAICIIDADNDTSVCVDDGADNDTIVFTTLGTVAGSINSNQSAQFGSGLATGTRAFAEGTTSTASGLASHAEGNATTASGTAAHSEGFFTSASGEVAHAEGVSSTASANSSHAEGNTTIASGSSAHAEGALTSASGPASHAEGSSTVSSGVSAHSEGTSSTASADSSHAMGNLALSSTLSGFAHCGGTVGGTADGDCQFMRFILRGQTTTSGPVVNLLVDATDSISLFNNSAYHITARVIAVNRADPTNATQYFITNIAGIDGVGAISFGTQVSIETQTLGAATNIGAVPIFASSGANALVVAATASTSIAISWCAVVEITSVFT